MNRFFERLVHTLALALMLGALPAMAEDSAPTFSKEQLDQLTAPIALYPDSLLSQILMAATYPSDVADAAKWVQANPSKAKGDDAVRAVESQPWDPSVKSLVAFPQVLGMMGEKPDWVQNLGDAFLASSKDVLDSVQRLRAKAKEAGNLKSNEQQKVVVKQEPAQPQVIVIEAADPQVVYVPSYNPTVVYGPWPYPAYPPYYYPPPPAYYGGAVASGIMFGVGVGITAALWSDCNWGHGDVDIDVDRHNNINVNNRIENNQNRFQHNSSNRRGVPYRDQRSQQQFGRNVPGAADRANYRGRDPARDAQRQRAQSSLSDRGMDPGRGRDELRNNPRERERAQNAVRDNDRNRGNDRSGPGGMDRNRGDGFDRGQGASANRGLDRSGGLGDSQRARGNRDNAFSNAGNAGQMRQQVDRGSSSRQQMSRGGSGGMRSGGGGGMRGGGGGRR
jgi:hypothetical protein